MYVCGLWSLANNAYVIIPSDDNLLAASLARSCESFFVRVCLFFSCFFFVYQNVFFFYISLFRHCFFPVQVSSAEIMTDDIEVPHSHRQRTEAGRGVKKGLSFLSVK